MFGELEKQLKKTDKCQCVMASKGVMDEIDPANDGFIAEYDMPVDSPKEYLFASPQQFPNILVLDNVTDGGLLGTLMRTATVFGYDLVVCVNHCADLYDPAVLVAARGAHFQNITKFVVLKDEDGDDESELLNQMVEHHRAQPFVYSPRLLLENHMPVLSLEESQKRMVGDSVAKANFISTGVRPSDPSGILTNAVFHPTRHARFPQVGAAIFLSEDKTESFVPKLAQRLRIPPIRMTIENNFADLPSSPESAMKELPLRDSLVKVPQQTHIREFLYDQPIDIAAPIILHGMRSSEIADRMTEEERALVDTLKNAVPQATRKPKENIVGEADIEEFFHTKQQEKYDRRMQRYQMTDEERFEQQEMRRIKKAYKRFQRFMARTVDDQSIAVMESNDPYTYASNGQSEEEQMAALNRHSRYPDLFKEKQSVSQVTRETIRGDNLVRKNTLLPSRYFGKQNIHYRRR